MKRVDSLDHLRGLMAIGIMIYHFFKWTFGEYESQDVLGVIGIYGVSIFYVLSGLTLYLVYANRLTFNTVTPFFIKRIFRILPLLWLSILLNIWLLGIEADTQKLWLNLTGLFGFFDHDNYITTGSWSIGNELVFYFLFPFIILINRKLKWGLELIFVAGIILGLYFSFIELSDTQLLSNQWPSYINPLNQFVFFIGGLWIGKVFYEQRIPKIGTPVLFLVIGFCLFHPFSGNLSIIVSSWPRLLFTLMTLAITFSFYVSHWKLPKWFRNTLSILGHISYSVYLLHAVVFWMVARYLNRIEHTELFLTLTIFITFLVSYLTYMFLEKNFIKLGNVVIKNFTNHKS